ncbi:ribonucleoside-diphosphate reductase subunit alpha (plasmid) [Paenibacillus thiaminolyticus]|uniref:ribonucleoside-diphosphate reductase subunit alpha n=1 Tax=Paenibacillus thiaminolyticus TaxID=49283 RepID=UPI00232F44C4|nr:ribonucleoside-diphosphate reductase subunit alpha [Paenibacillus thiaminolyticus]WCF11768.1 ribonucleoside-diphosphate reductase subunit alpha [Paenibacillus thiaminolyticus]
MKIRNKGVINLQYVLKPNNRNMQFDPERLKSFIQRIMKDYPYLDANKFYTATLTKLKKDEIPAEELMRAIYMTALEFISIEEPEWTYVASLAFTNKLYKEAAFNRGYKAYPSNPYGSFSILVKRLVEKGIYKNEIIEEFSEQELRELGECINYQADKLFDYIGIKTLQERYLASDYDGKTLELPQERFMMIAISLMLNEGKLLKSDGKPSNMFEAGGRRKRLALIKEAYWALSNLYMTTATPTLANAGKAKGGQLSSCFVDTVNDDLRGIFDSNTDIARLSKMGGGIGVYLGKVRSRGASIRGYHGKSSGIVPWIRQLNNTAVSVDQLGTRKGSIAVYLDIWHRDILAFLDLKLNNGDERMRAHDIFTGVCIPDIFMEAVEKREQFYLFDPHEVREIMGWSLEDFFDEEIGNGTFRKKYEECVNHPMLSRVELPAIDIMKRIMKAQLETGTPYMFYRDTANRANPNKAHGVIYSSNLCVEIMQNMSATNIIQEKLVEIDGEKIIMTLKRPGDFVVCNLASINLGRAVKDNVLKRLIPIMVRMLDNVIDLNCIEVQQAMYTNQKYRAIGLGTSGLHHLLAQMGIMWESEEAIEYNDHLYELIAYLTIKASMELSKEKGSYDLFPGSEWQSSQYFKDREYTTGKHKGKYVSTKEWIELAEDVKRFGIRNGYLLAIAPTGSTSIIAGTTASIDPIYKLLTYQEKTTYKIASPVPELTERTIQYYRKNAFMLDQHTSIRMNATRQRHIDQSQSFNLYVRPDIKAKAFLLLHLDAWKSGLKSTYYVRSQALTVDECDSCQ